MRNRETALALLRVSTDEQALQGVSLAAQLDAARTEADRQALTLSDVITEDGYSAKTIDPRRRPRLASALARLDARESDALIVQRLDRLSRRMSDVTRVLDRADAAGWSLIVISPALDSAKPTDRVFFHMMALIAEQERSLIIARTTEGMRRARSDGAVLGRPRMPRDTAARILALCDSGMTPTQTARALDDAQIPTPQGGQRWHPSTVARAYAQLAGHDLDAVKWLGRHGESEAAARARLDR